MARKIFVTYKHNDRSVYPINGGVTARAYVDELIDSFEGDEIYKGEGNEDLSEFKDETIASHLRDKIYDSSITLVLISPNMKETSQWESDQWIPWEVSFSLKETTRSGRTSRSNGMLAVVLPNIWSAYDYYLKENSCWKCNCRTLQTDRLFQILHENMFNIKEPEFSDCDQHANNSIYLGDSSYIYSVKWCDFIDNKDHCIEKAIELRDKIDDYNICKVIKD